MTDINNLAMMHGYNMDTAGTRHGYRRDMDFTHKSEL